MPFPHHMLPRFGLQSVHATILQAHGYLALGRYAKPIVGHLLKAKTYPSHLFVFLKNKIKEVTQSHISLLNGIYDIHLVV